MNKYLALLVVGLLLITGCSTDPVTVVEQFQDAVNSQNVEAAIELLADDAELQVDGAPSRTGKTEIENWLVTQAGLSHRIEGDPTASGSGVAFESCSISSGMWSYFGINPMSGSCELALEGGLITNIDVQFDVNSKALLSDSRAAVSADLVGIWTATGPFPGGESSQPDDIVRFHLQFVEDETARWALSPDDLVIAPDSDHPGARIAWTYDDYVLTVQNDGPASEGYCLEQDVGTYLVKNVEGGGIQFKPISDPCSFRKFSLQRVGSTWDLYVP